MIYHRFGTVLHSEAFGLLLGAVALGAVHGIEPGHGWPVAASYALGQSNKWVYGLTASLIIGVGHLISSVTVVLVFFGAKSYLDLARVDEPIHLVGNVSIGGPVSVVAGRLLVALGVREYQRGHSHGGPDGEYDHSHGHDQVHDGDYSHGHDQARDNVTSRSDHDDGFLTRLRSRLPFGDRHVHSHDQLDRAANRSRLGIAWFAFLLGIAWFAFLLGFAHEEEFEIVALCAGSAYCLELMLAYAVTVVLGIVGLTTLLIAGYERYENRVETHTPYLPAFSAGVLVVVGTGFIIGHL
jgi:hypothetical protein